MSTDARIPMTPTQSKCKENHIKEPDNHILKISYKDKFGEQKTYYTQENKDKNIFRRRNNTNQKTNVEAGKRKITNFQLPGE